jgi:hypothetical protein
MIRRFFIVLALSPIIWVAAAFGFDHPDTLGVLLPYLVEYQCGADSNPHACSWPVPRMEWDTPGWVHCDLGGPPPRGYWQCSTSTLAGWVYAGDPDGYTYVRQNWSYEPWTHFTPANGDGGQLAVVDRHKAVLWYTQDGSYNGLQHFCGDGWLIARDTVPTNRWASEVINLGISKTGWGGCADAPQSASFTQYGIFTNTCLPGRWFGDPFTLCGNVLISEHYGAATPASSCQMERFFFALHLGWVRWEAWNQCGTAPIGNNLAGRCPQINNIGTPYGTPAFVMLECRALTNFVVPTSPIRADRWGWP